MNVRDLEPKALFGNFADISEIPRGSYNTKQISDFLAGFAQKHGLRYVQDEINNVVIYKEATPGYENAPIIILQGHMDMVCEKEAGCSKDMSKEGLDLMIDGDWLCAEGTTLGGDDGFAVAAMMALLEDDSLKHPALECVFTVDEETGLEGAHALDPALLKGRLMINLDSEDEGIFSVSCAGGVRADVAIPLEYEKAKGQIYRLTAEGLLGGHSGIEIHKEHANANNLMGRLLCQLDDIIGIRLINIEGGNADNVICKKCTAVFACESNPKELVEELQKVISAEYALSDPDIRLTLETGEADNMLTFESSSKLLGYLLCAPSGIQHMSAAIEGLVETSLNLGIVKTGTNMFCASYSLRSSVKTRKEALMLKLKRAAMAFGGSAEFRAEYPAWEYKAISPFRDMCVRVFEKEYGYAPKIEAIHAGLECGLFAGKLGADFDAVSIGPTMKDVHTPDERLSISSTQRFWSYLLKVLEEAVNM